MSNALLALLYSSASSASAASSAPSITAPVASSTPPPASAAVPPQPGSASEPARGPSPAAPSASTTAATLASLLEGGGGSSSPAPPAPAPPAQSAALSASNSLLALLTPPAAPSPAPPAPPPLPAAPATAVPPPSQSQPSESTSASLFDTLIGQSTPSNKSRAAVSPSTPSHQTSASSQPATASSLLTALLSPGSTLGPVTPQTAPPAPVEAPAVPAPAEKAHPEQASSPETAPGVHSLLQALISPIPPSATPVPATRAENAVSAASTPQPTADGAVAGKGDATAEAAQTPAAPESAARKDATAGSKGQTFEVSSLGPTSIQHAPNGKSTAPVEKSGTAPKISVQSSLPGYIRPGPSHDRIPIQQARHQVQKLTTTSGISLGDSRTSGLTVLDPQNAPTQFHLDLARLQPAGVNTLYPDVLKPVGIALLPQQATAPQAPSTGSAAPAATPAAAKTLVATLPSPTPASAKALADFEAQKAGTIVLYTLSRARVRAVHRETGARTMLSPPPNSSFSLSANAKVVQLVSGHAARDRSSGGANGETPLLVVGAIIQDGLRREEGGEEGERVEYYLCAWGLPLDFGRPVGSDPPPRLKTEARVLVMASLPATEDIDAEPQSHARGGGVPSLVWEATPPLGAGVGPFGSLLLRGVGEDAQLWRIDVERCECRTGFALEVLQKGKGAARLGFVAEDTVFTNATSADAPVCVALADADAEKAELQFTYAQPSRLDTVAELLTYPDFPRARSTTSSISFFGTLSSKDGRTVVVVGLNRNTEVLLLQLSNNDGSRTVEVLASWLFDAPAHEAAEDKADNLLSLEPEHTQALVLAQSERASVFILPLSSVVEEQDPAATLVELRWTEFALGESLSDIALSAAPTPDGQTQLSVTASYPGGVHVINIPASILRPRTPAPHAQEVEAAAVILEAAPVEQAPPVAAPSAAVARAAAPPAASSAPPASSGGVKAAPPAAVAAPPPSSGATKANTTARNSEAAAPAPAPTPIPAPTAKAGAGPEKTGKAAVQASTTDKKPAADKKSEKSAVVNGSSAVAPTVDIGPVMSLLKQQIGQVVIPEVKASTRQAVQEYLGSTLPEAVLAALPHELHRFLLRPDLSAHLIRTISAGILPDVQRTAVDTVTRVLAPEFEEIFGGLEDKILRSVESEMVNLRKDVVAEQGTAMLQTEGLVKEMSARMAELRSAVLGLNAANARMEKVLLRMGEREERREAAYAEERTKLLEVIDFQQRKMEATETSFSKQVTQLHASLEEHRSELRTLFQQQAQTQLQPQSRPRPVDEWGGPGPRGWNLPPAVPSPPPPPASRGSFYSMGSAPPFPELMGQRHPGMGMGPGPYMSGAPPPPPSAGHFEPPCAPPTPAPQLPQLQPQRPVPEKVNDALIQALGAPGIEQDPAPLRDTLHTLYARHGSIQDALFSPSGPYAEDGASAAPDDEVTQPVLLALIHRLAMALDSRARLGPNPPVSLVLAGTGGALEVSLAVTWLEAIVPHLQARDARIERQYGSVVAMIREAIWRAVQGLKGGPDGWWDEKRARDHLLAYLWVPRQA